MALEAPLRVLALGLVLAPSAFVLAAGCGNTSTACVPGQSVACVGPASCADAFQVCNADGSGYGECRCGGDDGGGAFPPVGPNSGRVGAGCVSADNCRRGLECVPTGGSLVGNEGPSGGLCLARCLPDHDFCNGLDAKAKCIVVDDAGTTTTEDDIAYCMLGCTIADAKDPDKCRSRDDMVCFERVLGSGIGYCRPACRSDSDCKPRFCDLGTGLCGDAARTGDPIGTLCDPANDTCAGRCFQHAGGYTECSGICNYHVAGACGQTRTDPPYDYFCDTDDALGSAEGDLGWCSKVCNCDADCGRPDTVCEPNSDLASKTGRSGVCGSKVFANGTPRKNRPCM